MLVGMLLVIAVLTFVGSLLFAAHRETRREARAESWNHRGAV